jgi:HAD superfamily phosphatase (TIGR01681 family)
MEIRDSELPVVIDVDNTLITEFTTAPENIHGTNELTLNYYGQKVYAYPIAEHIDLLKSYKSRGYEITVWSANGSKWAAEVVKKLKLTDYVDIVASKPLKYVDDRDANNWMQRVYIGDARWR